MMCESFRRFYTSYKKNKNGDSIENPSPHHIIYFYNGGEWREIECEFEKD